MANVSVIIPTFNRAAKAARAVSSILYQRFKGHEIIVVDDGSTDETQTLLRQFKDRIHLVVHGTNRGVSAARNTGI
ncbi:MAG: glycosyltransferase, partial [Deltaproteobacteria bacterium]|nr:glycosyltransferase [Deltaproteobacteria bacterium]